MDIVYQLLTILRYTIVIVYTSIVVPVVEPLSLTIFKIKLLVSNMKAIYTFTLYIFKIIDILMIVVLHQTNSFASYMMMRISYI